MKIIILGAGQIGITVAQHLAGEPNNEVTIVDTQGAVLQLDFCRLIKQVKSMDFY